MNKWTVLLLATVVGCAGPRNTHADEPAKLSQTATATSQDQVLDMLHQSGLNLKEFTANVAMSESDTQTADEFTRSGKVWYQIKPAGDARMRVLFDKKSIEGKSREEKVEYLLDNGWLTDRTYRSKKEIRRQVLRPDQKVNLLKLGEGPFPLPIGQDKESVYKEFDVSIHAPAEGDPANSAHVTLVPKDTSKLKRKFKSIDVWVDLTSKLPVRIDTLDRNGATLRSTKLQIDSSPNPRLKDADFTLPPVQDWQTIVEPFED